MKNYHDVVTERFDAETDQANSIYAATHPIGKYSRKVLFGGLDSFLREYMGPPGVLAEKCILDVGCGDGGMLEFFMSRGFLPQHAAGIDLSKTRIEKAKKRNPEINFNVGDVLTFSIPDKQFHLVTSFDLFSHLASREQLIAGLKNAGKHLAPDGIFLWYDIYSKDHFSPPANADSWGFNKSQLMELAQEAGFEMVGYKPFFRNFFNRYHSIYQVKRFGPLLVKCMEKIIPGMPGNVLLILKKK